MGASAVNSSPFRIVKPKGSGQIRAYAVRVIGGTTGANTVVADSTSAGVTTEDTGTTGLYRFTLPGKGGCTIGAVFCGVEGPAADKDVYCSLRTEADRTVEFIITDQATTHGDANLDADEWLHALILVTDV